MMFSWTCTDLMNRGGTVATNYRGTHHNAPAVTRVEFVQLSVAMVDVQSWTGVNPCVEDVRKLPGNSGQMAESPTKRQTLALKPSTRSSLFAASVFDKLPAAHEDTNRVGGSKPGVTVLWGDKPTTVGVQVDAGTTDTAEITDEDDRTPREK